MGECRQLLRPGNRVVVTQQVPQRDRVWTARVEGEVVSFEQQRSVSPFAHGRNGMLWLDRLVLRKDDGEIAICNLDQYSRIEQAASQPKTPQGEAAAQQPQRPQAVTPPDARDSGAGTTASQPSPRTAASGLGRDQGAE